MAETETARYERKFLISAVSQASVEQMLRLHPAKFRELYARRFVNNCYFDSPLLANYRTSVEGHAKRTKIRIRWYGDLFGPIPEPVLEIKERRGQVGTKARYPLPPLTHDQNSDLGPLSEWVGGADLPDGILARFGTLRPTLINRYSRQYLSSADQRFRVTIDTELEYHRVHAPRLRATLATERTVPTILEIKYATESDPAVSFITDRLPVRLGKSSKYLMGLKRLGHW